jgi:phosphatidylcholine synthase
VSGAGWRAAAWGVHLYTSLGVLCALLALLAAGAGRLREAFLWLALQVAIDASDGGLARLVDVQTAAPQVDGNRLDDIVDYLTYVFVPAVIVVSADVVPGAAGLAVAAGMLVSSALGFSRTHAKTTDHFFTGFPSYWNIVVLYLVGFRSPPVLNAAVLLTLAALVFVPIRYVYPSRTPTLRVLTLLLGLVWGGLMMGIIFTLPEAPAALLWASLGFPVYYLALSLGLEWRRRRGLAGGSA